MRKKIWFSMIMCACVMMMTCTSCDLFKKSKDAKQSLNVTELVKADKDQMSKLVMGEYKWFETQVVMKDYLDTDASDGTVIEVTNVFECIIPDTTATDSAHKSYDVKVYLFNHTLTGDEMTEVHDWWMGDNPISEITLNFEDAYKAVMAANYPKPHSRNCTLRNAVGPKKADPQWIFGNPRAQLYVNAMDGKVSDKDPVYEGVELEKPLGEWP